MSWNNAPQYSDNRPLLEIPIEEVKKRITNIINSNPVINGSLISTDGNLRQTLRKFKTVLKQIKKEVSQFYKDEFLSNGHRTWNEFQDNITKLITNILIYENYEFYLQNQKVTNDHNVEKGKIWFLPSYFCLKNKYGNKVVEFFSNIQKNYHAQEFYCENLANMRHPCLTIEITNNHLFWVLICSSSDYCNANEPITLVKNGSDHKQFVSLDWKIQSSRKMLDIKKTEAFRFDIDDDELNRIQGRLMLKN